MSGLQSSEPWTAPSLQPIDFINNCTTYGAFAAPNLRHGSHRVPLPDAEAYLIDAFKHHNASAILPSRSQLIGWYDNLTADEPGSWTFSHMREPPMVLPIWVNRTDLGGFDEECAVELRSHLDFEMDGDIVGIGVGTSLNSWIYERIRLLAFSRHCRSCWSFIGLALTTYNGFILQRGNSCNNL